jgi:TATA-box binding protein (TBP) (component of TFIID and TFIIIB)
MPSDLFGFLPKTESEIKDTFAKLKQVFQTETKTVVEIFKTYQRIMTGESSVMELQSANRKIIQLLQTAGFILLITVPGVIFLIPELVKMAREYDVDLVPASVSEAFEL